MRIRVAFAALAAVLAAAAVAPAAQADWYGRGRPPGWGWRPPPYRPYPPQYGYGFRPTTPFYLGRPPVIYRPPVYGPPPVYLPPPVFFAPQSRYYYGY